MKIRNGFVSNSSSSSFIMVGIKLSDTEKLSPDYMKQLMEAANFDWEAESANSQWYKTEEIEKDPELMYEFFRENFTIDFLSRDKFVLRIGSHDGVDGTVIGIELASTDNDCFKKISLCSQDINKIGEEVKKKFGIGGDTQLFIGTRSC